MKVFKLNINDKIIEVEAPTLVEAIRKEAIRRGMPADTIIIPVNKNGETVQ